MVGRVVCAQVYFPQSTPKTEVSDFCIVDLAAMGPQGFLSGDRTGILICDQIAARV